MYSIYYITCDIIGHMEDAPSPESLAAFDGLVGTWFLGFIIIFFKGPEVVSSVSYVSEATGQSIRTFLLLSTVGYDRP